MRILFDITHPVDINFFKYSINKYIVQGHDVKIIYRKRGRLEQILNYELPDIDKTNIGSHAKKGFIKKIIVQLKRDFHIYKYLKRNNIELVVCFGSTSAISTYIYKVPYLSFDDDFEYKIPFYHANIFSTRHIYPDFIEYGNKRVYKYHGFKELAYLHNKYFKPKSKSLDIYDVKPNEYVFIREIAGVSLNYRNKNQNGDISDIIKKIKERGLKVILSLEDKSLKDCFISDCIILEEPVKDIYSLLFFSLFTISSGDTVAREASLLGVPSIYTGGRKMAVNKELTEHKLLVEIEDLSELYENIYKFNLEYKNNQTLKVRRMIQDKWDDTNQVISMHLDCYIHK